jgi:hypothetical protein
MRRLTTLFVAFALLLVLAPVAVAQEGTPAAGSPTASTSLLAGLGYADLVFTTDGNALTLPADVTANRYRLVVDNASAQLSADVSIGMVPDGQDPAALIAEFQAAENAEAPPASFFEMVFVGGVYSFPGTADDAIITLAPGTYIVSLQAYSETDEETPPVSVYEQLNVTGELPELTDPAAEVTVTMLEMAFEMPDTIAAGPQIWHLTNTGAFPHFMVIDQSPQPVTPAQVQATLDMFFGMGTPTASPMATPVEPIDPESLIFTAQGQVLSTGQSNWLEIDLAPGTYIAFCFVSGPGEVPPHAALGMFKVFTVA